MDAETKRVMKSADDEMARLVHAIAGDASILMNLAMGARKTVEGAQTLGDSLTPAGRIYRYSVELEHFQRILATATRHMREGHAIIADLSTVV